MRMTSKGQVTIPQDIRQRFGLNAGTEVEVVEASDGALVRPAQSRGRGDMLVAALRDRANAGMTADEVLRMTRGDG